MRATVNRSTFYAHFEDKYDLFDHVIHESFEEALQATMPEPGEFCLADMHSLILAVFEYLKQMNSGCSATEMQFRPMIEMRVQAQLYDLILEWIERLKPDEVLELSLQNTHNSPFVILLGGKTCLKVESLHWRSSRRPGLWTAWRPI